MSCAHPQTEVLWANQSLARSHVTTAYPLRQPFEATAASANTNKLFCGEARPASVNVSILSPAVRVTSALQWCFCLLFLADTFLANGSGHESVIELMETRNHDSRVNENGPGFSNDSFRTHTPVEPPHTGWMKAVQLCRYIHHMAAHVVLISFVRHPSGHYLPHSSHRVMGARTSSECVMRMGRKKMKMTQKKKKKFDRLCVCAQQTPGV